MTLTSDQILRIQETIEKKLSKSSFLPWGIRFGEGDWFVTGVNGEVLCRFPEIPSKSDLDSMVAWGTAIAPENMGSLWRSQLEYLAHLVIPEAFEDLRGPQTRRYVQAQQMQQ